MTVQLILMGVSGCGKSTLGLALADRWSCPFIEGDALHAPVSVAKMAAGLPLDDDDRWPWLDRIGSAMVMSGPSIASCSALRRAYRDRLRAVVGPGLRFTLIDLSRSVLERRMLERTGHYMPASLLDSQLGTLERPREDEPNVLFVDGAQPLDALIADVSTWMSR